jgi:hypothetical protein
MDLYIHSLIRLHGVVLNKLRTERTFTGLLSLGNGRCLLRNTYETHKYILWKNAESF